MCPGCPHRSAFFVIRRTHPKAIFTSDIGCYTLGLNLGAVDTCLDMGAAVTMAAGFYHAFEQDGLDQPVVATIGDSTFFHSGIPALIDAVVQDARFLLVVLDNRTTAMTGNQPTPATGKDVSGAAVEKVAIRDVVKGCGVSFVKAGDPLDTKPFIALLKEGLNALKDKGPAVILAESPCLLSLSKETIRRDYKKVAITETCDGCGFCVSHFECPALVMDADEESVHIDYGLCTGCGVCVTVCPKTAIVFSPDTDTGEDGI